MRFLYLAETFFDWDLWNLRKFMYKDARDWRSLLICIQNRGWPRHFFCSIYYLYIYIFYVFCFFWSWRFFDLYIHSPILIFRVYRFIYCICTYVDIYIYICFVAKKETKNLVALGRTSPRGIRNGEVGSLVWFSHLFVFRMCQGWILLYWADFLLSKKGNLVLGPYLSISES